MNEMFDGRDAIKIGIKFNLHKIGRKKKKKNMDQAFMSL